MKNEKKTKEPVSNMTLLELVTLYVFLRYWLLSLSLRCFFLGLRNFFDVVDGLVLRNLPKSSRWRFVDVRSCFFLVSLISSLQEETRKHEIQHEINRLLDEMLSLENRHHWRRRKL